MATKTLKTRIILRNDTQANWTSHASTVLSAGEVGLVKTSTGYYAKVGDGTTQFGALPTLEIPQLTAYYTKSEVDGLIADLSNVYAEKATTLAGYGITDAKIENGTITLGSETITPLTAHQPLTAYYQKSETSSATELTTKFGEVEEAIADAQAAGELSAQAVRNDLTGYVEKATVGITYDSTNHKIKLTGTGAATDPEIDAADFIKDGMVDTVSYDAATNKIVITFNTDAGKSDISVDVGGLVDVYTAGTGLTLNGNEFAVDTTAVAALSTVNAISTELSNELTANEAADVARDEALSNAIDNKVKIAADGTTPLSTETINIYKVTNAQYRAAVIEGTPANNDVYIVNDVDVDAFGGKVVNVGTPTLSSDAATKGYVDNAIEDAAYELPVATTAVLGGVKSSATENQVAVDSTTGVMTVNDINVNKLVQTEGDELVLDGGNA